MPRSNAKICPYTPSVDRWPAVYCELRLIPFKLQDFILNAFAIFLGKITNGSVCRVIVAGFSFHVKSCVVCQKGVDLSLGALFTGCKRKLTLMPQGAV